MSKSNSASDSKRTKLTKVKKVQYTTMIYQIQLKNIMTNTRLYTIWQSCTLNIMSFRSKARPAKLWELSSQGTEISPQNCQIEVQQPRLATNNIIIGYDVTIKY